MKTRNLEGYIDSINSCADTKTAFSTFRNILKDYGYDRVMFTLVTDHPSLNLPKQPGLETNYPTDWIKHYIENDCATFDPVRLRIQSEPTPFFWDDLVTKTALSQSQETFMELAKDFGVMNGIGLSMFSNYGEITGIGASRSDYESERNFEALSDIHLLGSYFSETYKSILRKPHNIKLSDRETEILTWASEGKTDIDISDILNISENTVRFHWKNIFKKLNAYGRVFAVTKAIRLQIISPQLIKATYQKR